MLPPRLVPPPFAPLAPSNHLLPHFHVESSLPASRFALSVLVAPLLRLPVAVPVVLPRPFPAYSSGRLHFLASLPRPLPPELSLPAQSSAVALALPAYMDFPLLVE